MMPVTEKRTQRRDLFTRVKALSAAEKAAKSTAICETLARNEAVRQAELICSFAALDSEPDLSDLVRQFPEKEWAFASFSDAETLCFRIVSDEADLVQGDFGILTPSPECAEAAYADIDLVLTPGVGFDPESGHRLGRGKGHYDRFFDRLSEKVERVGVCFATQLTDVATESHDIAMHTLVTEEGLLEIKTPSEMS